MNNAHTSRGRPPAVTRRTIAAISGVAVALTTTSALAPTALADSPDGTTVSVVDPDATTQTLSLFDALGDIATSGSIAFGQQNAFTGSVTVEQSTPILPGDVYDSVGDYPAIAALGVPEQLTIGSKDEIVAVAKESHRLGTIVTIEDHMPNLTSGGKYNDVTPTVHNILPGGTDHRKYLDRLDLIAAFALESLDDSGNPIPIIYRPFHENSGTWFWWGASNTTRSEFIDLWRFTVDYLRDVKGVHNFLYAYSPNAHFADADAYLTRWPGDEYVDIVGFDSYHDRPQSTDDAWFGNVLNDARIVTAIAKEKGKVAAATEIGLRWNGNDGLAVEGNPIQDWYQTVSDMFNGADDVELAYMATWRQHVFNANSDYRHFWVPYAAFERQGVSYPDHEMLDEFRAFAAKDNVLFREGLPADVFTRTGITTAAHPDSVYLLSPRRSNNETYSGTVTLQAGVTGEPTRVEFVIGQDGEPITGVLNADTGYYEAVWNVGTVSGQDVRVTVNATFTGGAVETDFDTPRVGSSGVDAGSVDDFESYPTDADLADRYNPNPNGGSIVPSLVPGIAEGSATAMKLTFDTATQGYACISRGFTEPIAWADGEQLTATVQLGDLTPGANQLFQVKTTSGTYYEVELGDLAGFEVGSTAVQAVSIDKGEILSPGWQSPAGAPLTESEIAEFTICAGGGDDKTGTITVDDVRIGEKADARVVIEDFEALSNDAEANEAYVRNGGGGPFVLSLVDGIAPGSTQAARVQYDATDAGYAGAGRAIPASDWTAVADTLHLSIQLEQGAGGDIMLQVVGTEGYFGAHLNEVADFDPESTAVQHLAVPLTTFKQVSWGPNPGSPLTGAVRGFEIYVNRDDSGATGAFVLDDVYLGVSGNDPGPEPGPEQPETPGIRTVVDDYEQYADTAAVAATYQVNTDGDPIRPTLGTGLVVGSDKALHLEFDGGDQGYACTYRDLPPTDWSDVGEALAFDAQLVEGTGWFSAQIATIDGSYYLAAFDQGTGFSYGSTAVQHVLLPFTAFAGVDWSNPTSPTYQGGEVRTFEICISNGPGVLALDNVSVWAPQPDPDPEPEPEPTDPAPTDPAPAQPAPTDPGRPGGSVSPTPVPDAQLTDANRGGVRVPDAAVPGSRITVTVPGHAGRQVRVWLHSDAVLLDTVTLDAAGSATVTIPQDTALGKHKIVVQAMDGSLVGWDDIRIGTPSQVGPDGEWLAATGAERLLPIGALILLVSGGVALLAVRLRVREQ